MADSTALTGYVVVSGPPGSGKTTLARALAAELRLPLLAKDTVKEALMATLAVADVDASRALGRASVAVLLAVARDNGRAVLESAWHRSRAAPDLSALPGPLVEVFCRCDPQVALQRYRQRSGSRAAGHFDGERSDADLAGDEVSHPVAGGWPLLEVATDREVDVPALAGDVRAALGG